MKLLILLACAVFSVSAVYRTDPNNPAAGHEHHHQGHEHHHQGHDHEAHENHDHSHGHGGPSHDHHQVDNTYAAHQHPDTTFGIYHHEDPNTRYNHAAAFYYPVILPNGVLQDTPEVIAARRYHLAVHHAALVANNQQSAHGEQNQDHSGATSPQPQDGQGAHDSHSEHEIPHSSQLYQDTGVPTETPEIEVAKINHFAARAAALHGGNHPVGYFPTANLGGRSRYSNEELLQQLDHLLAFNEAAIRLNRLQAEAESHGPRNSPDVEKDIALQAEADVDAAANPGPRKRIAVLGDLRDSPALAAAKALGFQRIPIIPAHALSQHHH